jgi:hypothetical protein
MKIYETGFGGPSGVGGTRGSEPVSPQANGKTAGSTAGDHVSLSSAIGSLSRALSSFHTGRAQKVQALTSQYQSGRFQVNAAAVSHMIVSAALSPDQVPGASGSGGAGGGGR